VSGSFRPDPGARPGRLDESGRSTSGQYRYVRRGNGLPAVRAPTGDKLKNSGNRRACARRWVWKSITEAVRLQHRDIRRDQ
jgi:hypothetical protein